MLIQLQLRYGSIGFTYASFKTPFQWNVMLIAVTNPYLRLLPKPRLHLYGAGSFD
jgi:hypothetical protein